MMICGSLTKRVPDVIQSELYRRILLAIHCATFSNPLHSTEAHSQAGQYSKFRKEIGLKLRTDQMANLISFTLASWNFITATDRSLYSFNPLACSSINEQTIPEWPGLPRVLPIMLPIADFNFITVSPKDKVRLKIV